MESEPTLRGQNMEPLLTVDNLSKRYAKRGFAWARQDFVALDGVSFTVSTGTALAIVGESGSGKSTLASCIACLETPSAGNLWFEGKNLAQAPECDLRLIRPQIQLIFPDPASSLSAGWTVLEILVEPLVLQGELSRTQMETRAFSLLERVGLSQVPATKPHGNAAQPCRDFLARPGRQRNNDSLLPPPPGSRLPADNRCLHSCLFLHDTRAWQLLRRDATEPADFAGNSRSLAHPVSTQSAAAHSL